MQHIAAFRTICNERAGHGNGCMVTDIEQSVEESGRQCPWTSCLIMFLTIIVIFIMCGLQRLSEACQGLVSKWCRFAGHAQTC